MIGLAVSAAGWNDAPATSFHLVRSMRGRRPDLQGTRGLMLWSGRTMAYTWMDSSSSELSQRMRDSLARRSSVSCSGVKVDGQPEFSYQKRSPTRRLWN